MRWRYIIVITGLGLVLAQPAYAKPLSARVNEAFRSVYLKNPTRAENVYWLGRVVRGDKATFVALQGAMYYHRARGATIGGVSSSTVNGSKTTTKDNKQTMIVKTLPIFVAVYGSDPSKAEKAWWRKRISCNEITSLTQLTNSMKYHKAKGARKGRNTICGQAAAAGAAVGGVGRGQVAGISSHPMGNQVRIGIFKTDGRAIQVTANGTWQIREGASKILGTVGKDDVVQISWSDGKYHVRGSGQSFDTTNKIRLVPLNQAIMMIKSYSDPSATIPGKNYNRFRGIIEIRKCDNCNELWAINDLRVEYYLRGLAETSGTGPEEYLKALGIVARTYVLYHKIVTGGRSPNKGWDITNTPNDQIYRGYEFEIITARMASIFNKSKGVVVTNGSEKLVTTVYFSDSDGRTRSAKDKWGTDRFPHIQQSVADPHHVASSCRGHCVGMSAQGAFGFAKKDGWSFKKILNYYYKGVKLVKAY